MSLDGSREFVDLLLKSVDLLELHVLLGPHFHQQVFHPREASADGRRTTAATMGGRFRRIFFRDACTNTIPPGARNRPLSSPAQRPPSSPSPQSRLVTRDLRPNARRARSDTNLPAAERAVLHSRVPRVSPSAYARSNVPASGPRYVSADMPSNQGELGLRQFDGPPCAAGPGRARLGALGNARTSRCGCRCGDSPT